MAFQRAVITGAGSGIGAGLARALVQSGCRVAIADIEAEKAQAVARDLGADAIGLAVDQSCAESLAALACAATDWLGSAPDLVVANAGVGAGGYLYKTPRRNIDWVFGVNLVGPILVAQAFVPAMMAQGTASRFVVTASEHAVGLPARGGLASIYTVSKHGALAVAETLRRDLAETQVAVSVICPAVVQSEIWNSMRNRPDELGGPRLLDESHRPDTAGGITAEVAGERILAGFEAGEFFVFTHGRDVAEVHRARAQEVEGALARFAARFGADA